MNKKKLFTNLFVVCITEFLILQISFSIMRLIYYSLYNFNLSENLMDILKYLIYIIPIILCLIYMKITYPDKLKVFTCNGVKKSTISLGIGLAIGFLMNSIILLSAFASGSLQIQFVGVSPMLFAIIIPCFIQCVSEEVSIRGYASSYLEDRYSKNVVAFAGGILFIFHHVGNFINFGFNFVFCLNLFLFGILLYFIVKVSGSIWTAFGIHTAWNYTQEYIFGSQNSGTSSSFSLFTSFNGKDSFFCNTVYGNEGTLMCSTVFIIAIILLYVWYAKKNKEKTLID